MGFCCNFNPFLMCGGRFQNARHRNFPYSWASFRNHAVLCWLANAVIKHTVICSWLFAKIPFEKNNTSFVIIFEVLKWTQRSRLVYGLRKCCWQLFSRTSWKSLIFLPLKSISTIVKNSALVIEMEFLASTFSNTSVNAERWNSFIIDFFLFPFINCIREDM